MNGEVIFELYNIGSNLLNANDDVFERFFEKLYRMDKEILYIFLISHKDCISKSQLLFVENYYKLNKQYYNWNIKNIIVCNNRKVSDFLGFKVSSGEDILDNKNCFEFILKYRNFFEDTDINNFKRFTEKTGINLTNIYSLNSEYDKEWYDVCNNPKYEINKFFKENSNINIKKISFNELGCTLDRKFNYEIYNHDLLVVNEADKIILKDNHIFIDDEEVYTLNNKECIDNNKNENLCSDIRYELSALNLVDGMNNLIDEQIKIIKEKTGNKYEFKERIKQIYLSNFQELFVLYEDGKLYKNNKLYAKDVLGIWEANSYTSYLIFKNYDIEYISTNMEYDKNKSYDKVIFNDYFIAFLKNKCVEVISISNYEEPDTNYYTFFSNVDDICISKGNTDIDLIVEKNKITHSVGTFVKKYN